MYGTHLSLTAVHTILRENDELCVHVHAGEEDAECWVGVDPAHKVYILLHLVVAPS